jgi:hypothetical protein
MTEIADVGTKGTTKVTTVVFKSAKAKKRRKYSTGLRAPVELERGASRVIERLAESAQIGMRTWRRRSNLSARKRRDGELRDAPENIARAVSRALKVASRAPVDAAKTVPRLRLRKLTRTIVSTILG